MPQLLRRIPSTLADAAFLAFLGLALSTPSWRSGPFVWWPVWQSPVPVEEPARVGLLSLLLLLCVAAWAGDRAIRGVGPGRPWRLSGMMVPLLALSFLTLLGLESTPDKRTIVQGIGLALFWFSLLFVRDRRPPLALLFAIVVVVQAGVAVAQFALQRDLGLGFLGEYPLDVQVPGTSVLWSNGEVWLRGYGLTSHPNMLGAMLALLLLVLLPHLARLRGWRLALLVLAFAAGLLGLLVSFSRTGWLAFGGGLLYFTAVWAGRKPVRLDRALWLPMLIVPVFVLIYRDLILSRLMHLDTLIEARSIQDRLRDAQVAIALIAAHPWLGVGAGNALGAALALRPDAGTVHNTLLLVTVESGIPGGLCWLALMLFPLLPRRSSGHAPRASGRVYPYTAAWVGLLIAGLFDTSLWLTTSWRAALLVGVVAALQIHTFDGGQEEL